MSKNIKPYTLIELERMVLKYINVFSNSVPNNMSEDYIATHKTFLSLLKELVEDEFLEKIEIDSGIHTYLYSKEFPSISYALTEKGKFYVKRLYRIDMEIERQLKNHQSPKLGGMDL